MGNLPLILLPPQNWQDFEKLIKGVVEVIWNQQGWHSYGRPGQAQSGIDLYGYDDRNQFTAFQCKMKSITNPDGVLLAHSLLTKALIDEEIKAAELIERPSLDRFIFATTSLRDTKIQDIIRDINHDRIKNNQFKVDIWFWEDFQVHIESHKDLLYWYYADLLQDIHQYDKDIHILSMLRRAFTRPAFNREIRGEESGGDFIQAIKNTQEAIVTGKLYNRRDDLITTSFDYKALSQKGWRESFASVYKKLDEIRKLYQQGLKAKMIREHETCLEVFDNNLADQFNRLRIDCLILVNQVLLSKGLEQVDAELLHYRGAY